MDRIETDLDREFGAVLAAAEEIAPGSHAARLRLTRKTVAMKDVLRPQTFRNEEIDRSADQFVAAITEQALDLGVDQHDLADTVDNDHAARTGLDSEPEFFLGKLLRCHVTRDLKHPHDLA